MIRSPTAVNVIIISIIEGREEFSNHIPLMKWLFVI